MSYSNVIPYEHVSIFIHYRLSCSLQVANLVGYVIGPSGINWLVSQFLQKEGMPKSHNLIWFYLGFLVCFDKGRYGANAKFFYAGLPVLGGMFVTFYVGTKVMVNPPPPSFFSKFWSHLEHMLIFNHWSAPPSFCSLCSTLMMPSKESTEVACEGIIVQPPC